MEEKKEEIVSPFVARDDTDPNRMNRKLRNKLIADIESIGVKLEYKQKRCLELAFESAHIQGKMRGAIEVAEMLLPGSLGSSAEKVELERIIAVCKASLNIY